jgi:hypothetical protein
VARVPAVGAEAGEGAGVGAVLSVCGAAVEESSPPPPQPARASRAPNARRHEKFDFIGEGYLDITAAAASSHIAPRQDAHVGHADPPTGLHVMHSTLL